MKINTKTLALFLALLTVVSVFSACGGDATVTTDVPETNAPETDAPETNAPETDAPETNAPETDAPETNAPETDAPETDPVETAPSELKPEDGVVVAQLNFDTELSVEDYIASVDEFEINEGDRFNGGKIKDGRWGYTKDPLALKDCVSIFSLDKFSVEFDFCFNSFVKKDNSSVFSLMTDDDGVLGGKAANTKYHIPFKMDMNGAIYHNDDASTTKMLETGKVYNYRLEVNTVDKTAVVYIDGEKLVSCQYDLPMLNYQCFRLMDIDKGADMWIDNLVVKCLTSN